MAVLYRIICIRISTNLNKIDKELVDLDPSLALGKTGHIGGATATLTIKKVNVIPSASEESQIGVYIFKYQKNCTQAVRCSPIAVYFIK